MAAKTLRQLLRFPSSLYFHIFLSSLHILKNTISDRYEYISTPESNGTKKSLSSSRIMFCSIYRVFQFSFVDMSAVSDFCGVSNHSIHPVSDPHTQFFTIRCPQVLPKSQLNCMATIVALLSKAQGCFAATQPAHNTHCAWGWGDAIEFLL